LKKKCDVQFTKILHEHTDTLVNGLNPGVSVVCIVWSSRWG